MILRFDEGSVFQRASVNNLIFRTSIPTTRDWEARVEAFGEYRTLVDEGNLSIIFREYQTAPVSVWKNATLEPSYTEVVFSEKYIESWFDGITEALQSRAIDLYQQYKIPTVFSNTEGLGRLSDVNIVYRGRIIEPINPNFLIAGKTLGEIVDTNLRPNKNAVVDRNAVVPDPDIVYHYSISLDMADDSSLQDDNTGIRRDKILVKSIVNNRSNTLISLYEGIYEGDDVVYVVPKLSSVTVYIGGMKLENCPMDANFVISAPLTDLSDTKQPLAIQAGDDFIPLRIGDIDPLLPLVTTRESGTNETLNNWLNS